MSVPCFFFQKHTQICVCVCVCVSWDSLWKYLCPGEWCVRKRVTNEQSTTQHTHTHHHHHPGCCVRVLKRFVFLGGKQSPGIQEPSHFSPGPEASDLSLGRPSHSRPTCSLWEQHVVQATYFKAQPRTVACVSNEIFEKLDKQASYQICWSIFKSFTEFNGEATCPNRQEIIMFRSN